MDKESVNAFEYAASEETFPCLMARNGSPVMGKQVVTQEKNRDIGVFLDFLDSSSVSRTKERLPPLEHNCVRAILRDPPPYSLPA